MPTNDPNLKLAACAVGLTLPDTFSTKDTMYRELTEITLLSNYVQVRDCEKNNQESKKTKQRSQRNKHESKHTRHLHQPTFKFKPLHPRLFDVRPLNRMLPDKHVLTEQ